MSATLEAARRPYAAAGAQIVKEESGHIVWPTVIASSSILLTYAVTVDLALSGSLPYWLASIIAFVCIHPSAAVLHEASHRAMSNNVKPLGWIDEIAGTLHGLMLTYDFGTFRYLHLRHHQHTNDASADPDYWMQGKHPLAVFVGALFVPLHYLHLYIECARKGIVPRRALLWSTARISGIIVTLIALMIMAPGKTFLLWVFPASIASAIVNLSHSMLHRPVESADRRMTTLIVRGERLWEWVVSPFFWLNNHHFLHHEYPRAPFTAHARMFRELEQGLIADGVQIITIGERRPAADAEAEASA